MEKVRTPTSLCGGKSQDTHVFKLDLSGGFDMGVLTNPPNVITLQNLLVIKDGLYTLLFYFSFKQELHP